MLAGIYYGSQYGGSTTSILMRIPGEASSVMTCIDGYAMAQKGRAGAALSIAAVGSFVAGTFGVIMLTVVAPPLANFALRFGPPEYTALLMLGLIFLAYMSSTSLVRTLLMASVGLLLGCIGIDVMSGHFRYSFDIKELGDGIGIVPVAVGLFGLGEILSTPSKTVTQKVVSPTPARAAAESRRNGASRPCRSHAARCWASSSASCRARRTSSRASCPMRWRSASRSTPEEFGKGAVAGVAGPESANNSASTGAFVPMLALGLPTGPVTAVLMAALLIHGVPPGPQLVSEHPRRVLGLHRLHVRRQPHAARPQPAAGRPVRERAAHPLRLPLPADHHVLHHRRLRGRPLHRRRVDHADHGRAGLRAAQVRLRPGAAGAGPRHRPDLRAQPAPVAGHVERRLADLLEPADLGDAARRLRGLLVALGHLRARAQGLARQARRSRGGRGRSA